MAGLRAVCPRAALVCIAGQAVVARGGIVYTDVPDISIGIFGSADLDLDRDGIAEIRVASVDPGTGVSVVAQGLLGNTRIAIDPALTLPSAPPAGRYWAGWLPGGAAIGSLGSFWPLANLYEQHAFTAYGAWLTGDEGYLGVRLDLAGQSHYGWVRATRLALSSGSSLRIFDFAYETEPGTAIAAGAVPAPASAGVLAVIGLTFGRRRR